MEYNVVIIISTILHEVAIGLDMTSSKLRGESYAISLSLISESIVENNPVS